MNRERFSIGALAIDVGYWTERMAHDADRGLAMRKEEALQFELQRFMDHALGRETGRAGNGRIWSAKRVGL